MRKAIGGFVVLWALVSIGLGILPASARAAETQSSPQYGGVLRINDLSEGSQPLGAPWTVRGLDLTLMRPAVESLLREDMEGNYHPWLATEWKIDQGKHTITLTLRKGVKFHDGTDLNAEAVKWCIDQAIEAKTVKGFKSVDVLGDYIVRINVDQYQNNMLNILAGPYTSPVSPTAYKTKGKEWAMWNPVGTGPFRFVSYQRGNKLIYSRSKDYWQKGLPYLDGIEHTFIRDPMTQQAAMRAGGDERLHVLAVTSGEQAAMLKAMGFKILSAYTGTMVLVPDSANPDSPLSKKAVREALSYAINRDAIVKARGFGSWLIANQSPYPKKPGYLKDLGPAGYDPKKAKQLLGDAGYPNGFDMKLIAMPALADRDTVIALQRFLTEVGVRVELEFPDGGKFTNYRFTGWQNAALVMALRVLATTNITYDASFNVGTKYLPSLKRPDGFVNKLNGSLRTATAEKAKMEELTRILADDMTVVPIYHLSESRILQPNVHDTGYFEWESGTVYTPEKIWMSK